MKNDTIIWLVIFVLGAIGLVFAAMNHAGETWVKETKMSYVGISAADEAELARIDMEQEGQTEEQIQAVLDDMSGIGLWGPAGSSKAQSLERLATKHGMQDSVQTVEWTEYKTVPMPEAIELLRTDESKLTEEQIAAMKSSGVLNEDGTTNADVKSELTAMAVATLNNNGIFVSTSRTIGVWLAALFTLAIMSFLVGDNPLYKTAEAVVVGASAAYWMVYSFYTGIVDKLLVGIWPSLARDWAVPGMQSNAEWDWIYIIPAVLSIMLLWRLAPMGGWISRWPLAFIIGATAGFRMLGFLESDFIVQIQHTISNLWFEAADGSWDMWASVGAWVVLIGVLACLTYFFFSVEHKGVVGKTARLGIYFLMVAFGSAFAFTVMGRITLLTERFGFLFRDWLHVLS